VDRSEGNFDSSRTAAVVLNVRHLRAKIDATGKYDVAGDEEWHGEVDKFALSIGAPVTVFRRTAVGRHVYVASEAITVGQVVSTAAAGKVQGPATPGAVVVGVAVTAAANDNDLIGVEPVSVADLTAILASIAALETSVGDHETRIAALEEA
jgi:hypothetical protein